MIKRVLSVFAMIALSACGSSSPSAPSTTPASTTSTPSSVTVSCSTTTFTAVGQQAQCSAFVVSSNGTSQDQTLASIWSSTNASVASVSATGLVTAVSSGSAT